LLCSIKPPGDRNGEASTLLAEGAADGPFLSPQIEALRREVDAIWRSPQATKSKYLKELEQEMPVSTPPARSSNENTA